MEDAIRLFGAAVMILSGFKLLVVLFVDMVDVVSGALKKARPKGITGFSGMLEKLPERYLTSIVAFLFGLLLASPNSFAAIWGQAAP